MKTRTRLPLALLAVSALLAPLAALLPASAATAVTASSALTVTTTISGDIALVEFAGLRPQGAASTLGVTVLPEGTAPGAAPAEGLLFADVLYLHGRTELALTVPLRGNDPADYRLAVSDNAGLTVYAGPLLVEQGVVTVPQRPAAPTVSLVGTEVTVSWAAPADGGAPLTGYTLRIVGDGATRVLDVAGDVLSATLPGLPAGTHRVSVIALNAVGASAASAEATVTVPEGGPGEGPGVELEPTADALLTEARRGTVRVPEAAAPGQTIRVEVGAALAGGSVHVWLHSTPVLLASVTLDASGATTITIPADTALGEHRVVVQASDGALLGWDGLRIVPASQVGPAGELLPRTGAEPFVIAAAAALVLGVGAALIVRRRREEAALAG